ncbi:MAG: glutaredoxin family protein [Stackebrandtia sp.]
MAMDRLALLVSKNCFLCTNAKEAMTRVAERADITWTEIDVADHPEYAREYGDRLPVVLLDGKEHGYWHVEEERLFKDLGDNG